MSCFHEYRKINGVETHLLSWSKVPEYAGTEKELIVCVTGNPGLPDFYEEFGDELYKNLAKPLYIIGHAGHEEVPDIKSNVLINQENKFNLQGQLEHKVEFINSFGDDIKLHLIGHSIGAWMLIEILNNNDKILARTASVQLLFPTIQKMAETRNGFIVNRILRTIHRLALIFITLLFSLPLGLKTFFIGLYLKLSSLPPHYTNRILKYINPRVIEKVLFLAYDEMDTVVTLNREGVDKIKNVTNVIYSDHDGWAPLSQIQDLLELEPLLQECRVPYDHAFVLRSSIPVAHLAASFIETKKKLD